MSMTTTGVGGMGMDQQTFNAQLVNRTLDTMNNRGATTAPVDKASFDGALVSKTLDFMNPDSRSDKDGMSQSFNFQKDVLGAHAGVGTIANMMI